jgi:membrane-associated phospholipid phosphatase
LVSAILRDSPDLVSEIRSSAPVELGRIIARCLEKEPDHRIQSARELHERLAAMRREVELGTALSGGEAVAATVIDREPFPTATAVPRTGFAWLVSSRGGLAVLLALVFGVNWLETVSETRARAASGVGTELAANLARAFHWLEGYSTFQYHDATNWLAVYGYSISYFFLYPLLAVGIAVALAVRADLRPFRVYSFSIAGAYVISLPFFIFFPIPERWAYPEAEATLLSDQWTSTLIETFRPISGLDNCFPSFHVSLTVVMILIAYLFRMRLRTALVPLAMTVVLSTFVLGIHWLADIVAGAAVGVVSVWLAVRLDRRVCRSV